MDDLSSTIHAGELAALESSPARTELSLQEAIAPERQLIERAKTDPEAFAELYELHYSRVLNYLFRCTLDRALAEDLTSSTFLKAHRRLDRFAPEAPFSSWLYRIATNEVRMHWRAERIRRRFWARELQEKTCESVYFEKTGLEAAEREREQLIAYTRLHLMLTSLPIRYQEVMRLRYIEQLKIEDVAEILGKRPGTVKSLIHRGLLKLRRRLENDATFQRAAN